MIIAESHPTEAMKLANQVAASITLVQIQPRHIRMESRLRPTFPEARTQFVAAFKQEAGTFELREADRILDVRVGGEVRFYLRNDGPEKQPDDWVARIEFEFILTYCLPPGPIPTEVRRLGLAAFSNVNARLACWPYIRHQVNHLASELGIPFVMPTLLLKSGDAPTPAAPRSAHPKSGVAAKKSKRRPRKATARM
ncbi:MAG: hypothetical protein WCG85_23925 [Polyangia bacterium]